MARFIELVLLATALPCLGIRSNAGPEEDKASLLEVEGVCTPVMAQHLCSDARLKRKGADIHSKDRACVEELCSEHGKEKCCTLKELIAEHDKRKARHHRSPSHEKKAPVVNEEPKPKKTEPEPRVEENVGEVDAHVSKDAPGKEGPGEETVRETPMELEGELGGAGLQNLEGSEHDSSVGEDLSDQGEAGGNQQLEGSGGGSEDALEKSDMTEGGGEADGGELDQSDHEGLENPGEEGGNLDQSDHSALDQSDHGALDQSDHGALDQSDHGALDQSDHGKLDGSDAGGEGEPVISEKDNLGGSGVPDGLDGSFNNEPEDLESSGEGEELTMSKLFRE